MQRQLLHPPVQDFGDVERILVRAGNLVNPAELLELAPRPAQHSKHIALQIELGFTVLGVAGADSGDVPLLVDVDRAAGEAEEAAAHGADIGVAAGLAIIGGGAIGTLAFVGRTHREHHLRRDRLPRFEEIGPGVLLQLL